MNATLLSFLFLVLMLAVVFVPLSDGAALPAEHVVRIEARQFAFQPGTVRVNPGDQVTFEVVATDVVHGLYLDRYNISVEADPGATARLTFIADRTGVFRFRCSVACGDLHPFMIGRLQVGRNELVWRGAALGVLIVLWSALVLFARGK